MEIVRMIVLFFIIIVCLFIRIIATARFPIRGLRSIPDNWNRIVLCTDINAPLEIIPGAGPVNENLDKILKNNKRIISRKAKLLIYGTPSLLILSFGFYSAFNRNELSEGFAYIDIAFFCFVLDLIIIIIVYFLQFFMYVSALLYRLSVKSTAVIWLPLIHSIHASTSESLPLPMRLTEIRDSGLWQVIRIISWITILALLWKILILPDVLD